MVSGGQQTGAVASALPARLRDATTRRSVTVPAVVTAAATLGSSVGVWAQIAAALDLLDSPRRMPRLRLGSLAMGWSALESVGVAASTALWVAGRSGDQEAHFRLQRWWADQLITTLERTVGLRFEVDDPGQLAPGPVVIAAQHASIADALVPVWLLGQVGMRPRYVMKDDLLLDPCLDIVGNRLPNHFVDRDPADSAAELAQLEALAAGADADTACIIFPEGGVVTDASRERAKARIEARDPERLARVGPLEMLGPVRPGGTQALLRGAPDADLVMVTHTGLEAVRQLANAPAQVPLVEPVRIELTRIARADIPDGDEFGPWLDERWAERDRRLVESSSSSDGGS